MDAPGPSVPQPEGFGSGFIRCAHQPLLHPCYAGCEAKALLLWAGVAARPSHRPAGRQQRYRHPLLLLLNFATSSAGSCGRSPAGWFLCSAMGSTPRAKPSRCQEQQVLARGWGTAALPGSQALRQPPACPPHSITSCMRLLPPQAPADDERNRTSGMLFPKKRGKKVLQTARQCPETCFQLPTVACQRCGCPAKLPPQVAFCPGRRGPTSSPLFAPSRLLTGRV